MDFVIEREKWQNYELPVDDTPLDKLLLKSQQFCVIQYSHAELSIKSSDKNPWIRCIAFCDTLDNAYEVARNAFHKGENMETRIIPSGKCTLVPRKKYERTDFDEMLKNQNKANSQFDHHVALRKETLAKPKEEIKEELKEVHSEKVGDEVENIDTNTTAETSTSTAETPTFTVSDSSISSDFGRPEETFMQRYGAFAIIADPDDSIREPVIIPLFAAESIEELTTLVKTVSHNVDLVHVDIHCGPMLEWLPLYKPIAAKTIHKHPLRQAFEEKIKWIGKDE
jgi:hypothetical protein